MAEIGKVTVPVDVDVTYRNGGEIDAELVAIDNGYGLGKCGQCTSEYLEATRVANAEAEKVNGPCIIENPDDPSIMWAVCLVPAWSQMMVGPGQMAAGVCAVGSCLRHINVGHRPPSAPGSGLLIAGGSIN
jgi:hypothetical protein